MKKLPLIDLHTCIQGEGRFAGVPHVLIRLTGCNLNCQFSGSICDTAYASWKPEEGRYSLMDIENILKRNVLVKHSFITGGEPTIFPEVISEIFPLLKKYNHLVALETNGTNKIPVPFDFITVSPKLSNSVPVPGTIAESEFIKRIVTERDRNRHEKARLNINNLKDIMKRFDYQFKFVISKDKDIEEVKQFVDRLKVPRDKVYLMPEGISNEQLQEKRPWLIDECIQHGFNYSDRLHIVAFGNKRDA